MIKLKNKLTITICDDSEEAESEQESQYNKIKDQADLILEHDIKAQSSNILLDKEILNQNNLTLINLLNYMEGENLEKDLSYSWINSFDSVLSLTKSVTFSPKSWENFFSSKSFDQEFKVSYNSYLYN